MNIKHLLSKYSDLFSEMGINKVYWAKKRQNGLTSSGKTHMCHWNVAKLITMYGGKMSTGYTLEIYEDGDILFLPHSVWSTPEGRNICVTNYGTASKYSLFAETGKFNPTKQDLVRMETYYATLNFKSDGIIKCQLIGNGIINKNLIVDFHKIKKSTRNRINYKSSFIYDQYGSENWLASGFSKPSTANGLSWKELCNRSGL